MGFIFFCFAAPKCGLSKPPREGVGFPFFVEAKLVVSGCQYGWFFGIFQKRGLLLATGVGG